VSFALRIPAGRLFRKHVVLTGGAMAMLLAVSSAIDIWWSYRDQEALLVRIQRAHADAAAARIADFVRGIEAQLSWMTHRTWSGGSFEARQLEALRLLRQVPPIAELTLIDDRGREQVKVSRLTKDEMGSGIDRSQDAAYLAALERKIHYGDVRFRNGSEPHVAIGLAGERQAAGVVMAEVDLKFVWDVVNEIRIGSRGVAFVVDAGGRLIAHPDMSLVLRVPDLGHLPQVRGARDAAASEPSIVAAGSSLAGGPVLSAHSVIAPLGWQVFVELPIAEAYAPVTASLWRSFFLLAVGLAAALGIALHLAQIFFTPIMALRAGAASIEKGDLGHRISIHTGDELEGLGDQFNSMASRLQASYADLERKVAARTRELEEANLAKTRFLAVASHDLRQPLHALGMFIGQLSAPRDAATLKRIVERAEASVAAMNELFDALLDISRIDMQQFSPSVRPFPVQRLLDRLGATYSGEALRKGLSLRLPVATSWILSDPVLLERILGNLVSNAIRYTRRGGVAVLCRRRADALRIEVWDSGPGIPDDQQQSIFAEFVRLEPARHDEKHGIGLGLAIVDRLARLLGHAVDVRSIVGRGSRFSVTVPTTSAAEIEQVKTDRAAAPEQLGDGRLIVLIDDDPAVREGTGGLLRSWGFEVVHMPSAEEAIAVLGNDGEIPALLIADYELAGGNTGIEGIAALRDAYKRPVPAFLISGVANGERLPAARTAGLEVLRKPLAPAALRDSLQRHLKTDVKA
jgi:signal transduction histidine kinase/ActR/RegA family two-component response regulator